MARGKTIEGKVADTILEEPMKVTLGGREYEVASPTLATLVKVSEVISTLPKGALDEENIMQASLRVAKDCEPLAEVVAVIILGAKGLKRTRVERVPVRKRLLFGFAYHTRYEEREVVVDNLTELKNEILLNASPREIYVAVLELLKHLNVGDFFFATTFLTEVNVTKPTKVVAEG